MILRKAEIEHTPEETPRFFLTALLKLSFFVWKTMAEFIPKAVAPTDYNLKN